MWIVQMVIFLLVGAAAGWLAGQLMKGKGFGLGGNLLIGVLGALLGALVFNLLGIYTYGLLGSFVMAVVGSTLLLALLRPLKRHL
jgi:uncharacterized membrane protein YeaQ/YmgE (transglycosylase-associated protein family)